MNKKLNKWTKLLWGSVLLLALQAPSFAQTAEITLYEAPGFGGRSLTLRGHTPNLEQIGFNDRAASIVVRSGTWQLCTDADFGGTCTTLTRGEYRNLDGRINGQLSSAREVGIYSNETGNYGNYRRGSVELFDRPDFQGTSILLDRDSANFSNNGFNDRARSIIVHDGTWTMCTARGFGGDCRTYARGRYANLGRGTSGEISSARMSGVDADAPYVHGGGVVVGGQNAGATNVGVGRVILFDDERMNGRSMVAVENMVDLVNTGFNDEVASIVVEGGSWEFCTDAFFRGQCRILKAGQYRRLDPVLFRSISSLRAASSANGDFLAQNRAQADNARSGNARPGIELFEHDDFQGRRLASRGIVTDLERENFNDIASSIVVYEGRWELCTDADFGGRCVVYGPGRYPKLWGLSDQLSSIRRIDR
jgi:Beta/Gamma crystallin